MSKANPNRTYYVCPRCNYQSFNKYDMKRHFERKRVCANRNGIDLTPELEQTVLSEFVYNIKNAASIDNNGKHYHSYNMIVGMLNGMESLEKLHLITDYTKSGINDVEDHFEKKFDYVVKRLESDAPTCGYLLTLDDLYNIVNNCTTTKAGEMENFNVFFDKLINRLKLYRGTTTGWESYLEDSGAKQLISLIKSYYLDSYEIYLIRNFHKTENANVNRFQLKEHLVLYYKFLAVFDLEPHIVSLEDRDVLNHRLVENTDTYLASTYRELYTEGKKDLKTTDAKAIQKKIVNIVKDNSIQNVRNLDKTIIDLLKIDQPFKEELLRSRNLSL